MLWDMEASWVHHGSVWSIQSALLQLVREKRKLVIVYPIQQTWCKISLSHKNNDFGSYIENSESSSSELRASDGFDKENISESLLELRQGPISGWAGRWLGLFKSPTEVILWSTFRRSSISPIKSLNKPGRIFRRTCSEHEKWINFPEYYEWDRSRGLSQRHGFKTFVLFGRDLNRILSLCFGYQ